MSVWCHERKCATAIGSSQPVQVPPTEAAKRKAARRMRSLELSIYSARLSSMESVEHKKERREPLFFGFIGKDATDHRRPYTSRTPGRSTPNAGRNGKQRRSVPRARCLPCAPRNPPLPTCIAPPPLPGPAAKAGAVIANASDRALAPAIPSFDIAFLHKNLKQHKANVG